MINDVLNEIDDLTDDELKKGIRYVKDKQKAEDLLKGFSSKVVKITRWFSVPIEVAEKVSPMASLLYAHFLANNNGIFRGSNVYLCQSLGISSRQLSRYINELVEKGCIEVVIVSKTTRFIYPLYVLPYVYDVSTNLNKSKSKDVVDTDGDVVKETPNFVKDFIKQLKK